MQDKAKFWNSLAHRYAKQPIKDEAAYQTKLQETQKYFDSSMEVLEFGCGTGSTALNHASHVKHIKAIDISPTMIEIATEKCLVKGISNVDFEVNTLEELNASKQSFDAILGLSIIHLLDDWQSSIARVYDLLKPRGIFVSSTPCLDEIWWLKLIAPVGQFLGFIPKLAYFDDAQLKRSMVDQGFDLKHIWQPNEKAAYFIIAQKPE